MTIRNFLDKELKNEAIHGGEGLCRHAEIFGDKDIDAPVKFINYTVVPPRCSFGMHKHGSDNEFYIVLSGEGEYMQDSETARVKKGDIIMNAPFASHCIVNTGGEDMALLVFEAAVAN